MKPIVVEFTVGASPSHAFDVWANRPAMWWPRDHTVSGADDLDIVFEGRVGGRIYERTGEGAEHEWGQVLEWDPPNRLMYKWHLYFDPSEATDIEVTFTEADAGTRVRLEQGGWERLGAPGHDRRTRTNNVWQTLTHTYARTCEVSAS